MAEPGGALFVPLATEPYRQFQSGEKTVEVRQAAPRWLYVVSGREVRLRRGYSTPDEMRGVVLGCYEQAVHLIGSLCDLRADPVDAHDRRAHEPARDDDEREHAPDHVRLEPPVHASERAISGLKRA